MKYVLHEGAHRSAMYCALTEIDEGRTQNAILRMSHGWKFFLLILRLLHRPLRGGNIPKAQLQRSRGEWGLLLASVQESTSRGTGVLPQATRCP